MACCRASPGKPAMKVRGRKPVIVRRFNPAWGSGLSRCSSMIALKVRVMHSKLLGLATLLTVASGLAQTCAGIKIQPGTEIKEIVAAHPPGTTYCIESGLYRLTKTIVPKNGDKLIGSSGAVLNGAKAISEWTPQGKVWVATGQTQRSELSWKSSWPEIADPTAQYNEDVFIDDKPLKRVLSPAEVGPGKFFFDYGHASIYLGDNPDGHRVECSATETAIEGHALENVVIRGLTIEKYTVSGISAGQRGIGREQ